VNIDPKLIKPLKYPPRDWQVRTIKAINQQIADRRSEAIRWMALALPGCGKSYLAALLARASVQRGEQVLILVTMSYLPTEFRKALTNAGVGAYVDVISPGDYYTGKKPIVIAMLQTLKSRPDYLASLLARRWDHVIYDEAHTSRNFEVAAYIEENIVTRTSGSLTGTYFQGTGGVDVKRKFGQWQPRVDSGCVFIAGSHDEMVQLKVLKPNIYHTLSISSTKDGLDMRSPESISGMAGMLQEHVPGWGRTLVFCASAIGGSDPIGEWTTELQRRGGEVFALSASSTEDDIQDFKWAMGNNPRAVGVSAGMGSVGLDAPEICRVAIAHSTTKQGVERLYQQIGRGGRYDGSGDACEIFDFAQNFKLPGNNYDGLHPPIEAAYQALADNPNALVWDRTSRNSGETPEKSEPRSKVLALPEDGELVPWAYYALFGGVS
jgi:superfamily II DNA or RNA helicase